MKRFLIADDHPLFREALISALKPYFPEAYFAQASDIRSVDRLLSLNSSFDAILLDLNMPGNDNFEGISFIKRSHPNVPIIVISATDTIDVIAQAQAFGASAFAPKSLQTAEVVEAIIAVVKGEMWFPKNALKQIASLSTDVTSAIQKFKKLTVKQRTVLSHLRAGMLNKQIAKTMDLSEPTIKAHVSAIYKTLKVSNRAQAIVFMNKFLLK